MIDDDDELLGGGRFVHFTVREKPTYTRKLLELCEQEQLQPRHFDRALNAVFLILERNPWYYPEVIMNVVSVRMAKTEEYLSDEFAVPPLRVYYTIAEEDRIVWLGGIAKRKGFGLLQDETIPW